MKTISGYQITKELYKSSNSLVYQGRQETNGRPVVLKFLNQAYPSPQKVARFKLEYEIIRELNLTIRARQPHLAVAQPDQIGIIEAYDLKTEQYQWVMILEDFGGEALNRLIRYGQFNLGEFLKRAIQIVDVLDLVHQQRIIHKDVNPSNIILNPKTGQLKLIDFGISTPLARENSLPRNPNKIEGTLAYISPEQTGRMNRAIDYRSDFYSLGVTFYEMLTGQLPFPTTDALELVHYHIARQPTPPHQINPQIPQPVSDIVLTLLAKNAEDRYQSPYGLKADLEECLHYWQTTGRIDPFPLHRHDVSSRFQIPQKLYGRAQELETLLAAFERIAATNGDKNTGNIPLSKIEMLLVSGYTGIGKSALVHEVYKPITRQRGYFTSGKFDQFQRNVPYASLLQAFRALVRQLLTESEAEITSWRERFLAAFGPNGQVIIEVIPELELIIGPQSPVPSLPPTEAQNRFHLVFQNFVKVFTQSGQPLVVFLDDLQWADGASLKLIEVLLTAENEYLLFIGAYRDNEVSETHPLKLVMAEIQKAGTRINQIALTPLSLPHVTQLITDALHCPPAQAQPLAELLLTKTGGNPFFINEFLKSLYTAQLLTFDFQQKRWQWDLAQIQAQDITTNVAELMAGKIQKLAQCTQQVIQLAACIGNQFDLQTLSIVYERSPQETAADLWPALMEDLILPLDDTYKLLNLEVEGLMEAVKAEYRFAHDQIQQAAYALITPAEKETVHRRVGQLLLQNVPAAEREGRIFDITNHLNLGRGLIHQSSECDQLAELNLMAGRKAKASAAYQPAFNYFQIGLDLLALPAHTSDAAPIWQRNYELALALHIEAAETAYLNANYQRMEQLVEVVLVNARTLLDKIRVYEVRIQAYIAQNRIVEAVQIGLFVLELLGIKFPKKPNTGHIVLALASTKLALLGKRIESLAGLPEMRDPLIITAIRIFEKISAAVYLVNPNLFPLIVFKQVNLTIKYGNIAESALIYASYAVTLGGVLGDLQAGYRFGQLAMRVLERFDATKHKIKTLFVYHFFVRPWREPLRDTLPSLRETYQYALDAGDIEFVAYLAQTHATVAYHAGIELPQLEREMVLAGEVIAKFKQERPANVHKIRWQITLNLQGKADNPARLAGEICDKDKLLPLLQEKNDANGLCELNLNTLILNYLFQMYPLALESAAVLEKNLAAITGNIFVPLFYFYDSLVRLALWPQSSRSEQKRNLKKVVANQKKMSNYAKHAPMNYLHQFYLVEAERARVMGHANQARSYYDQAIDLARVHQYVNEEALACELAAQFYLAQRQTRLAYYYLRDARYAYLRWGATAKVKDLETRYPQLLVETAADSRQAKSISSTTDTGEHTSNALDFASILKASQAISGEIVLDRLLEKLMKIVIENAGAQRGYLILEEEGNWVIEAEAKAKAEAEAEVTALQALSVQTSERLPLAIINYVTRTRENVVLNDASHEGIFTGDPYILQSQPKSILCAPLINQGKLTGILYLENNLTPGAFTPDQLELLNILSAQAAISIENARLYTYQVQMTNAASRFVPHEFLQFLKKESIVKLNLGDQAQQNMTITVSDIRSFTTLSETMTPQENFDFVNVYLGRVSPIIRQYQGFIAKYMGDGIMAVFPGRVEDAIDAAIAQLRELARYNADRQQQGEAPIQIGLGIHGGPVMLGTVGEVERMQLDLLSDAVNVTARLEGLTKLYGVPLVISTEVLKQLAESSQYQIRFLGKTQVKGRHEMLSVFEVFDGDPPETIALKVETKADFEKGLSHYYDWDFDQAKIHFMQVLQRYPADKATQFYLERMADFTQPKTLAEEVSTETLTKP